MLLKIVSVAIAGYFVANWLFREPLRAFLGKLDRKINRVVNATLIALVIVYALRIILLWMGIQD